jgi:Zn finger protein HypA/HybF involved in hydrogenase expression
MKPLLSDQPSTATPPSLGRELKQRIELRLAQTRAAAQERITQALGSYWLCLDCLGVNTREEDDHGQPAYCGLCRSHRLKLMQQVEVLEPQDLYD